MAIKIILFLIAYVVIGAVVYAVSVFVNATNEDLSVFEASINESAIGPLSTLWPIGAPLMICVYTASKIGKLVMFIVTKIVEARND